MTVMDVAMIVGGYAAAAGLVIAAVGRVIKSELLDMELRLVKQLATKEEVRIVDERLERHIEAS